MSEQPKRYQLDCLHDIWLKVPPNKDDQLWCKRCQKYEHLIAYGKDGIFYDAAGQFKAQKAGRKFLGWCLHENCADKQAPTATAYSHYGILEKKMHSHYMREHTRWITVIELKKAVTLPPNSEPPF